MRNNHGYITFQSEKDKTFTVIIFAAILLLVGAIFFVPHTAWLLALIDLPVIAFMAWTYFDCYYQLREEFLFCKIGPFFERIPYDNIASLRLCKSLLSSMALSRNQIEIRQHNKSYITGTTLISPVNREEFINLLKDRCLNLGVEDDEE